MLVDAFDFDLPPERIARHPAVPRDAARLLHVRAGAESGGLVDRRVLDLPQVLRRGDLLVLNDTRVIPARLLGRRGEVAVEMLLHRPLPGTADSWACFAKPGKRLKPGQEVTFESGLAAVVVHKTPDGLVHLRFNRSGTDFIDALHRVGHVPLPPYLRREDEPQDRTAYQTIYARKDGAVAAPTAGLHFTPRLFEALSEAGVGHVTVTLHVGAGTFLPVKVGETDHHKMHAEWGEVTPAAADAIAATREAGGRIVAVGTTVLRLLESAAKDGEVRPFCGDTALFIVPGYDVKTADLLMTNFHLPRSTLFMLVCAFAGLETMQAAYAHAIATGYRFYSYGDACLLERR